jgi:predicted transcriptional regulator
MRITELAESLGKVPSTIEGAIRKLRESGRLERVRPDKGGSWRVLR